MQGALHLLDSWPGLLTYHNVTDRRGLGTREEKSMRGFLPTASPEGTHERECPGLLVWLVPVTHVPLAMPHCPAGKSGSITHWLPGMLVPQPADSVS